MAISLPDRVGKLFLALSHPMRLRLLQLLGGREVCVCELVEALGQPQPKISQHLAALRNAGIVAARREGKWMHYRIVPAREERARRVVNEAIKWLGDNREAQASGAVKGLDCCLPAPAQRRGRKSARA